MEYATTTGRSGKACTDEQQKWNRGTLRNLSQKRLADISFERKHKRSKYGEDAPVEEAPPEDTLPELPVCHSVEQFYSFVDRSGMKDLFMLKGTLLGKCYNAQPHDVLVTVLETVVHGEHTSSCLTCTVCKQCFDKFVVVNQSRLLRLEQETRKQSSSVVWRDARRIRVTASTAKKVPVRETTNPDNFVREHLYPSFHGNTATEHGKLSEPKAIQALTDMGFQISARGTVVCEEEPWLSASPDGVTDDGYLVEVKCPLIKDEAEQFTDRFKGKAFCDIVLQDETPVLEENGKRGYYMQVQLAMHCTGLRKCIFFVWSDTGHMLVRVGYNEKYVLGHLNRLRGFYFSSMLPRLTDDFNEGRLELCPEYKDMMRN